MKQLFENITDDEYKTLGFFIILICSLLIDSLTTLPLMGEFFRLSKTTWSLFVMLALRSLNLEELLSSNTTNLKNQDV